MNKDASITGVWGGRGSGKSTRIKEIIKGKDRVIALDPLGEYAAEGFIETHSLKELYKVLSESWNEKRFGISLNLMHAPDPAQTLRCLSGDLIAIQEAYKNEQDDRKITLVLDEMSLLVPNTTMQPNQRQFLNLCNLGRHYGVEIVGASQRLAQVHTDFRGNCAEHYFFRMSQAVDLTAAKQVIKEADQLPTLAPHEFMHWSDAGVTRGKNQCNFKRG